MSAPPTIDLADSTAVGAAIVAGMKYLPYYYAPAGDGAWNQAFVQWHESGEYWNIFLDYRKFSGDTTYDGLVQSNMYTASFKAEGDFLGGSARTLQETLYGKWNDDIAWWALAAVTGAEIFGKDAPIVNGKTGQPSWFAVANTTYYQMIDKTDQMDSNCGGGIYWARDRKSARESQRNYKSTISNVQAMQLAARLSLLSPSNLSAYKSIFDSLYKWLKTIGIITPTYTIYDGITATAINCPFSLMDTNEFSYQFGVLAEALVAMAKSSGDVSYIAEADKVVTYGMTKFVNPATGGLYDPMCSQYGGNFRCKDPAGYMWPVYKGLWKYYKVSTNTALKSKIQAAVTSTIKLILPQCTSDWNCIRTLNPIPKEYTLYNGTNPRDQFEAMEALLALGNILGSPVPASQIQTVAAPAPTQTGGQSNTARRLNNPFVGQGNIWVGLWTITIGIGFAFLNGVF